MLPSEFKWPEMKVRRDELRALGLCICGPKAPPGTPSRKYGIVHGPVVQGGKCQRCLDVHRGRKAQ